MFSITAFCASPCEDLNTTCTSPNTCGPGNTSHIRIEIKDHHKISIVIIIIIIIRVVGSDCSCIRVVISVVVAVAAVAYTEIDI